MGISRRLTFALTAALALSGCGAGFHRMPDQPVLWDDPDRQPFGPKPEERYVSWRFDAVDHLFLRPASEVWRFPTDTEALNVNALDEVPDSSWFTNRIGRRTVTPEEVARGACVGVDIEIPFPWTVVGGKTTGTSPGFTIEDASGARWLLKSDGPLQPERASAADAIAAALFAAAGYNVPCNRVAYVGREQLRIGEGAEAELLGGASIPITDAIVDAVLARATRAVDGRYRAALSRFVDGEPLGPWSFEGTNPADYNDVVPHQQRRDVRGLFVFYAWVGHIDARQENTLSAWIERDGGRGYLRHHLIDFGDCFGVMHENKRLSWRFEHDHYLNLGTVLFDFLTAGLIDRSWQHARLGPAGPTLGYFDAERFEPDEWAPGYPNPAFDAHTEHDAAWMARILARFSREHVEAAVAVGRLSRPIVRGELVRVLMERRRQILERYLTRLSPLAWPSMEGAELCLDDLAVQSGLRSGEGRRYEAAVAASEPPVAAGMSMRQGEGRICVVLPDGLAYVAVDIVASSRGRERTHAARVHVYGGEEGYRAVALQRLGDAGTVRR